MILCVYLPVSNTTVDTTLEIEKILEYYQQNGGDNDSRFQIWFTSRKEYYEGEQRTCYPKLLQ